MTTHQALSHSKSRRKYKQVICRYNFGINFSFIISFLSAEQFRQFYYQMIAQKERIVVLEKCKLILTTV